ncbi:MAG TPA: 50S ribosomal protein L25 [Phycisphaerae bacterium]|jgi:large subunit ribosomal protein L25|nr:50S ribosomal protein L25 [Phycisphaerae bacterium]
MAKHVVHQQHKPVALETRTARGSRQARLLRGEGKLPGIVYGLGKEPLAVAMSASETVAVIHGGSHTIDVAIDGKTEKLLIQDVQYDYLQTTVEHVDLLRIDPNKKVSVRVALDFRGTPKGAKEGGILETQTSELEIEVSPLNIPDHIRVNIEGLELHQILHAREIQLPEGATLADSPEKIIAQVRTVKEEVAAVAAETTTAEPEVIGKKKEEEGAEAAPAAGEKAAAKAPAKK